MRFSAACERNQQPILELLSAWLPASARVLEVGSGSGQHAVHMARHLAGIHWQPSDLPPLDDLKERLQLEGRSGLAPAAAITEPMELDVTRPEQWPAGPYDAVFTANSCHIMPATAVPQLLAGAARVLTPGGLLLLYGPFRDGQRHTAPSNAAFDAHLRAIDPAMGVRDAGAITRQATALGLELRADAPMPANNRVLVFMLQGRGSRSRGDAPPR
jgi:SAM-dependent methyltransferase